jgi:hypothetical protein
MTTIKANAELLEQQSGVESSLTDEEIREHLEIVTKELRKQKNFITSLFETYSAVRG